MKLPSNLLDNDTLARMKVGDRRYTTPWAMWVDSDMECWLHPDYPALAQPAGTVSMLVERTQAGYVVSPPSGETYRPTSSQPYVSPDDTSWIPVAGIASCAASL